MRARSRLGLAIVMAGALAACEHTEPFRAGDYGSSEPLTSGAIVRLTYSPGQDLMPVWTSDGREIIYTAERLDRADHDRCLAFLPAPGGAVIRYACRTSAADDSLNVFDQAAVSGDGQIAYVRASNTRAVFRIGPDAQDVVVGPIGDPNNARALQRLPFTASWGTTYDAFSHLAWLGHHRIAAIGERVTYPRPCSSCVPDTVRTGVGIVTIDFSGAVPVLARLAAGDSASSLVADASGDTLHFTRDGDSRVYRLTVSSGQVDTVYDFGASGFARDVSVSHGTLAAIVGGDVSYSVDSLLGASQRDHGGPLFLLIAGAATQIGDPGWRFRRPALSPDGAHLVVAAWSGDPAANLWLFQLP
jgi:WD40-like Beta Propeller Repeat